MQPNLPVGAPAHLDALLQFGLVGRRDGQRQRGAQQGRPTRRLQIAEQVASLLRALVALVGNALVAVGLRPNDLVGILDAAAREANGERHWAGSER